MIAKLEAEVSFKVRGPAFWITTALGALNTVLIIFVLALLMCCAPNLSRIPERTEQQSRAVELRVLCGSFTNIIETQSGSIEMKFAAGSGVIVGPHRILTAAHVPACSDGRVGIVWARLGATVVDLGKWTPVSVDHYYTPDRDIASLYVEPDTGYGPIEFRDSVLEHESVCASFAYPTRHYDCGPFKRYITPMEGTNAILGIAVVGGNSGSGLFDRGGRLVGIITAETLCNIEVTLVEIPVPGLDGETMQVPEVKQVGGPNCDGMAGMLDGRVRP